MPINSITQTISTLPPAGRRGVDVQTQFVIKQEDFQDHLQGTTVDELNTLKDQLNSRISEINSTTTTMNGYVDIASAGASTATTNAAEASTSASAALAYKNQAETFKNNASASATKASQWANNNYNVEVETGKYSAKHWSTVAQNATANKVDKVTSTDNAVVRFDGATGQVQNSGVIIADNGNVGIGAGAPIDKLTMYSASGNLFSRTQSGTSTLLTGVYSDGTTCVNSLGNYPLILSTNNTERMRIDTNGNVGIGDGTPQYKVSIGQSISLPSTAGSKITAFSKYTNVGNASYLRFDTVRTSAGSSHNSSEERIRKVIDASEMGYVGFGEDNVVFGNSFGNLATLSHNGGLLVNAGAYAYQNYWSNSSRSAGTDWMHFYGTSNNNSIANIIIYGNGSIQNANNSYGALSDIKLKENIIDTSPKLDKLMKVRVVNYNLIGQEQKQIGVIAQEIEQIFPGLIDETKDTKQVEIEKERLIPALDEIVDNDGNVVQESKPEYIEKYMDIETIETGETTKSVKYSVLYMMMLKGMQEQQEIINSLVKRVETLEGAK